MGEAKPWQVPEVTRLLHFQIMTRTLLENVYRPRSSQVLPISTFSRFVCKPPEEGAIGSKACERKYKSPLATKCPPSCIMKIEIHELLTTAQIKIIKVDSGD